MVYVTNAYYNYPIENINSMYVLRLFNSECDKEMKGLESEKSIVSEELQSLKKQLEAMKGEKRSDASEDKETIVHLEAKIKNLEVKQRDIVARLKVFAKWNNRIESLLEGQWCG